MPETRSRHSSIPHLELRPQGYVWRRRVPRDVLRIGRSDDCSRQPIPAPDRRASGEHKASIAPVDKKSAGKGGIQTKNARILLYIPLKTCAFYVAAELARRLNTLSDLTFLYATATMSLSTQETTTLLTTLARFLIEASDSARALADPRSPQLAQMELEQEMAVQATLRQAFLLRDYSVAQEPLANVARQLGIQLPDGTTETAKLLAYEATRVMLDVSRERHRRDQGEFDQPSPYFANALADETPAGQPAHRSMAPQVSAAPLHKDETMKLFSLNPFASRKSPTAEPPSDPEPQPQKEESVQKDAHAHHTKPTAGPKDIQALLSAKGLLPSCSPEILATLEKGSAMTVDEAFAAYVALKSAGFADDWHKHQKADAAVGEKWQKSSSASLKTARKIWVDLLGSRQIGSIQHEDVEQAIQVIRRLPKHHGKGEAYKAASYTALVAKVEARVKQAQDHAERALRQAGCTNEAQIQDARQAECEPTIRVETFIRNVRAANRVGTMLYELGILDTNPFSICTFSNREEKALKRTEANIAREAWDDRLDDLLKSPVFQGEADGEADPLFWLPLIALLMGLRMEEAAQLGPKDIQKQKGVAYAIVHQDIGNSVKSESGTRKVPIHPALIELGFLDIVETALRQKQRRLFQTLTRGANKGTYSENFTKAFGYYRRKNGVYWHGLDFHALRTTFHHRLMDASCPGAHRRKLMGHEPLDEGEKSYAQNGISIRTLFERVKEVPFGPVRVRSPVSRPANETRKATALRLVRG